MGFLDFFNSKKDNETKDRSVYSINNLDSYGYRVFNFKHKKGQEDFGTLFLTIVMEKIFKSFKNIEFKTNRFNLLAGNIANFLNDESTLIINSYYRNGYIAIKYSKVDSDYYFSIVPSDEVRFDSDGKVMNKNTVVIYSDTFVCGRKSLFQIIKPYLKNIDNNLNNANYIIGNLGVLGILSGKELPISPAQKAEFNEKLSKNYGIGEDKSPFLISNSDLNFQSINLPFSELEINNNVTEAFKNVCRAFGINPDVFIGDSTFANGDTAKKALYDEVIIPLAEIVLRVGRALFTCTTSELISNEILTFRVINVPEINRSVTAFVEERKAYLSYLVELNNVGVDVSDEIEKLRNELKDVLTNL